MVNLILGLGGTGAKLVESFVHLCATGLGPAQASVAFIDQDQANGNTARARTALDKYVQAHRTLTRVAGEHPDPRSHFLRTRLDPHPDAMDVESCRWVPQQKRDTTLANLIEYSLMDKQGGASLARLLFHEEEELRMSLNEGYRGRPHVGAAALLSKIEADVFWKSLREVVETASDEVRVFLCGSVFGGTGAAVLPTVARRLRHVAQNVDRRLFIAGGLMLPYFTFPPAEDRKANVATGHELLLQSQSALQYYQSEMDRSRTDGGGEPFSFDDLYLVGWNPAIELKYHAAGAGQQVNPPLAPELFGALAAAEFFSEHRTGSADRKSQDGNNLHIIARAEVSRLDWEDLPAVPGRPKTASAYASWLRFCALWHFNYGKAFRPEGRHLQAETWFRDHTGRKTGLFRKSAAPDQEMDDAAGVLDEYVAAALRYAAAMSLFSTWAPEGGGFNLWTARPIADIDRMAPKEEAVLEGGELAHGMQTFRNIVRGFESAPDADVIYGRMSEQSPAGSPGLWPLVAYLHAFADPSST